MNINIVKGISVIFALVGILCSCNIAAGSYPYAEEYEIKVSDSTLILAILQFKEEHIQYKVPEKLKLIDGPHDEKGLWSHIYFYFPEENEIIHTWTQPITRNKTTFAFVSVNKGLVIGNWKEINKDFSSEENEEEKRKFEKKILNKIKEKLGVE